MTAVGYKINIGGITITDKSQTTDRQLVSLVSELTMDGIGGQAVLELGEPKMSRIVAGTEVKVTLESDNGPVRIFTGEVQTVTVSPISERITAVDGLAKLAQLYVEAAYEEVTSDFIVKEIIQQAELETGTIEKGPEFPSYVLHRETGAIHHVRCLAKLCGADLYTDGMGKVHFARTRQGAPDHLFRYGEDVLLFELRQTPPLYHSVTVWGEGAASQRGPEKSHWLTTDLSGVSGAFSADSGSSPSSGGHGERSLCVTNGAVRSGEAAQELATAQMTAIASRRVQGYLHVLGKPGVEPGDLIGIQELPDDHAASGFLLPEDPLRVRRVRHTLNVDSGFLTRMEF